MLPPKRYSDIEAWFRAGMKVLHARYRDSSLRKEWTIDEELISGESIMLRLTDKDGHVASLVMARKGTMSR